MATPIFSKTKRAIQLKLLCNHYGNNTYYSLKLGEDWKKIINPGEYGLS